MVENGFVQAIMQLPPARIFDDEERQHKDETRYPHDSDNKLDIS